MRNRYHFKNFSVASTSNGGLIEWQITLGHLKRFLVKCDAMNLTVRRLNIIIGIVQKVYE